jgi:hypothetical protein
MSYDFGKPGQRRTRPAWERLLPWGLVVIAAFGLPWALFSEFAGYSIREGLRPEVLWAALWPILVAGVVAVLALLQRWNAVQSVPQGDVVVLLEPLTRWTGSIVTRMAVHAAAGARTRRFPVSISLDGVDDAERALLRWAVSGPAIVLLAVLLRPGDLSIGQAATSGRSP